MANLQPGIELAFANGFYRTRSPQLSTQRCINYYPIIHKQPALSLESLYATPGIVSVLSSIGGLSRGAKLMGGLPYFVQGNRLFRIDRTVNPDLTETFTAVNLGEIPGSGRVIMAEGLSASGRDLIIVEPGISAFSYNTITGVITDLHTLTNFLSPVLDVVVVNGFYIFLQDVTNTLFHSNLNDSLTYNALDFEIVNAVTTSVGLIKYRNRLSLMSTEQLIPFNFIGGANFVFQAQVNAGIDTGLRSIHAKVNIRQSFVYLGIREDAEPGIWLFQGGTPIKISTAPIDFDIQNLTETQLDKAFLLSYSQSGGEFVVFIAGDLCYTFDIASQRWHERRSKISGVDNRWRVNALVKAYNRIMVGDVLDGRIGSLDDQTNIEYDDPIFRSVTLQPFDNKGKAILVKNLLLAMDVGFGGDMTMDWSSDGHTYSDAITRSAGDVGQFGTNVQWDRIGESSFYRVLRLGTSSNAPSNINKIIATA